MTARDAAVPGDENWPGILHRWAALPAAERARLLRSLKPGMRRGLIECWERWAHGGQLPPDGDWRVWLMGAGAALDRPVVETTAPACRAMLGDARCRVAMAARRRFARVVSAEETAVTLDTAEPVADAYAGGTLRWFGGANAGLVDAVAMSAGASVTLEDPPRFVVAPGVLVELIEGCDKRLATCAGRFGNAVNFRGEPFLPGIDLLTRYPGA